MKNAAEPAAVRVFNQGNKLHYKGFEKEISTLEEEDWKVFPPMKTEMVNIPE